MGHKSAADHSSSSRFSSSSRASRFARFANFFACSGESSSTLQPSSRAWNSMIEVSPASRAIRWMRSNSSGQSFCECSGLSALRNFEAALEASRAGQSFELTFLTPPAASTAAPTASKIVSCQSTDWITYAPLCASHMRAQTYAPTLCSDRGADFTERSASALIGKPRRLAAFNTAGNDPGGIMRRVRHF